MNSSKLLSVVRLCNRSITRGKASAQFEALKAKQAKFQVDDGLPVHLKGGVTDKILFQATCALILVGTGMMGKLFWDLSVPKK